MNLSDVKEVYDAMEIAAKVMMAVGAVVVAPSSLILAIWWCCNHVTIMIH